MTDSTPRLCPVNGMTCRNYACRNFGCMMVGKTTGDDGAPTAMQNTTSPEKRDKQP